MGPSRDQRSFTGIRMIKRIWECIVRSVKVAVEELCEVWRRFVRGFPKGRKVGGEYAVPGEKWWTLVS